jgi:DNA (cytosine-5)-methyltransferase 1
MKTTEACSVPEISMCLNGGGMNRIDAESETLIAHALRADGFDASEDGTGRGTPLVPVAFRACGQDGFTPAEIAPPITSTDGGGAGVPTIAFSCKDHGADAGDLSPTLRSMGHDGSHANAGGQVAVAFGWNKSAAQTMQVGDTTDALQGSPTSNPAVAFQEAQTGVREYDSAGTLRSNRPGHDPVGTRVRSGMAVRRLTPTECERLQGVPDNFTAIPGAADGHRYKALGNGMARPCIAWIGRRLLETL